MLKLSPWNCSVLKKPESLFQIYKFTESKDHALGKVQWKLIFKFQPPKDLTSCCIETDDSIQAVLEESEARSELENYHSTNFLKELASWSFFQQRKRLGVVIIASSSNGQNVREAP